MGVSYTVDEAADLAVNLPPEARIWSAVDSNAEWTFSEYLLWSIEYTCRVIAWRQTIDGQKGQNPPHPIQTPADRKRIRTKAESTDMEEIARTLGLDFGEVNNG